MIWSLLVCVCVCVCVFMCVLCDLATRCFITAFRKNNCVFKRDNHLGTGKDDISSWTISATTRQAKELERH